MAMTVVPNPDGSYTVECDGAKVVVGGRDAPAAPPPQPPYVWPEPDDNDDGVVLYLHVGRRRPPRSSVFGEPTPLVLPQYVRPPAWLDEALPGARMNVRVARDDRLELEFQVPAGQAFDVAQLRAVARAMRAPDQRVRMHIYVETAAPAPLDYSPQNEAL